MTAGYFDDKVGPLKRAAIDAYMKSHSGGHWQITEDKYVIDTSDTDNYVTRPGADGEGGGDWETDNFIADLFGVDRDDEFQSAFNDIRSEIDGALAPWRWIPEGSDVAPLVESMRQANRKLSVGAVDSNGVVTGGGAIAGNLNLILENSDAMAGGLITSFKSDFLAQLGKAVSGQHAITVILGGHLAAQEQMWEGARQTVTDIIQNATDAFNAAATGGSVDWKVVLKVVGYAVAGASIFATKGAAKTLGVADLGVKILDAAIPTDEGETTNAPGADYSSVMSAFTRDLEDLDTKITDEEKVIRTNINDNLEQIRADQGSYDLSRPPLLDVSDDSDLGAPSEIHIEPILVKEITGTYMPNVADELIDAKSDVWDTADLIGLIRDSDIGVGQYGPSSEFHELRYLLIELLGDLGSEVKYSAKTLDLAIADIGQTDSSAMDALEKHAQQVADFKIGAPGGAYDPWN